ncbi:endonuclease domain-containing 1 protein-like [Motacilla alba alba]|uniref:endonuclease domain-containing 1 protein-like n=1 Tax=Motacilla alba alba TaxID=1094192 RepID=UPI0018D5542E|nr:endonuclease domain-containing 1 protein-like [Motacilla alba alba]XP_038011423.1 endonuclease domain-containing 1 protein-like [Motacilla alba alba]XP_038011424.1 endonuclease domain-containing 1 protein-like [Motacilla alba alba]
MLGLLLLQVLASCLWLGHSEVVNSFAECPEFFYAGTTPNDALNPNNPAWICQSFRNSYHYATLYDRDKRIPVYSAYIYLPGSGKKPHSWWFVEPQLIDKNSLNEMARESVLIEQKMFTLEQIKQSQAVLEDYEPLKGLDRGHLCPSGHHNSRENKTATFTLTNIVPQDSSLNNGQWRVYELTTMIKKTKGCKTTYVITGAVPGNTYITNGRVNRPSHIWSAACCLGDKEPKDAWGAIAENDKNEVKELRLGELEERLTELYKGKTITLFNNACPRK